MSSEERRTQRGPFKQFCYEASTGCLFLSAGVMAGLAAMKTIASWAGKYAEWDTSDWILSAVLAVLYVSIPLVMRWYATKEDKPDDQRDAGD